MISIAASVVLLLLPLISSSAATVPSSSSSSPQWMSLSKNMQFLPAPTMDTTASSSASLRQAQHRLLNYYQDNMVDGMETQYNDYAQAWRLLGFYTDCNANNDGNNNAEQERRRKLEDGGDEGEEEDDEEDEEEDEDDDQEEEEEEEENQDDDGEQAANNGNYCRRYLLWAAYVDLDYEGNGLSEYILYNPHEKEWDKTACQASLYEDSRCTRMDCHLSSTGFKTLGYFRQESPVEFFQLLAQHQGSCSWKDEESNVMDESVEWLPQQCTKSASKDGNNNALYFDLKPTSGGGVDVGLYTNAKCSKEYTGSYVTVDEVLTKYYNYDIDAESDMETLNQALDTFKVCTPCRTYNLGYNNNNNQNGNGDNDDEDDDQDDDQENQDPNNAQFVCNDNAGYNGVNQCMVFAKNSEISKASFKDITEAAQQGTINRTFSAADVNPSWWQTWHFFFISLLVFLLGLLMFTCVAVKRKRISSSRNQPLLRGQ